MSRVGLMVLVCVSAGCTSGAHDASSAVTSRPSVLPAATSSNATSAVTVTSAPTPTTTKACSADNDPLTAAKTFVVAAETGDQATIARCTYPAARLSSDLIAVVASGGWTLDQVRPVQKDSTLKVGPNAVGFDFPQPPQSRGMVIDSDGQSHSLGPDHQSGLQIAVTLEPDGLRYVTDVLVYASS